LATLTLSSHLDRGAAVVKALDRAHSPRQPSLGARASEATYAFNLARSAPVRVLSDAGCGEGVAPPPVVDDAHDPPLAQGEDVEDLAIERLVLDRVDAWAASAEDDCSPARVNSSASISRRRSSPQAEGLDHLLAAVADPLLAHALPGHVGIEQRRRDVEVAAPKRTEEVDHDGLQVFLADAWH
jgi:hypothetical protein